MWRMAKRRRVGKEERGECGQRKRGDEGLTEKEVEEVSYERRIG
jgi:hypothetical protein